MYARPSRGRAHARRARPLIVHSHLRWDFVWQRPQQLLSRIAADAPVLFLEEPVFADDIEEGSLDITTPWRNVYRAVPRIPGALRGEYDLAIAQVRTLVLAELRTNGCLTEHFDRPIQWFYTPMPAPAMLGAFHEVGVVYDCMDELSQFKFAHPDLLRREQVLLSHADVVFTGGYKLSQTKARYHDNVHFFGCGVDAAHFAKANDVSTLIARDVVHLPGPVAGYYGVIDERLDYTLLAALAANNPKLQVVMVGPVVKVDPRELPRASNLHWIGQRSYDELPSYVKAFDVCLMPFALNEATEYINPTKTLEYMAARKPIVSTAVADVVRNFTPVVNVALSYSEFIEAVLRDALRPDQSYLDEGMAMAKAASWSAIVARMQELTGEAIAHRRRVPVVRPEPVVGLRAGVTRASA